MGFVSWHEESELGSWRQLDCRPSAFSGLVESVYLFDGKLARRERFYPTGELDLIIQLGEPFRVVEGQAAGPCPEVCLTGLLVAPLVIETPARVRMLGVRLRPAGAFALFGGPLHEVTGTAIDLHDLIGREARRLAEQLAEADSDEARLGLTVRWIAHRLAGADPELDPRIAYAVAEIESAGGRLPIRTIVRELDASPKRFAGAFERQVGVKPKLFSRIVRFRELAAALPTIGDPLSQLAVAHGYYDHAHMNLEFREFAGMSPSQFLAATPYADASSLVD